MGAVVGHHCHPLLCGGGQRQRGHFVWATSTPHQHPHWCQNSTKVHTWCQTARAHHGTMPKVGQLWGAQQQHWAMQGPWCPWGACCGTCTPPGAQGGAPPPIKFMVCVGGGVGEFQCLVHPRGHPKLAMCGGDGKWPHGVHGVAHHVGAPLAPPSTHLAP